MVFPDDLKWRHDYLAATGSFHDDRSAICNPRFRTWGTEELLICCIRKNLPWIRAIHIILARPSQVQPWMAAMALQQTGPQLKIVCHQDFMPKEVLPTFNSRAIEMYLHRIPDLADCFLYGNDDMFPITPMVEEDFFRVATESQHTGQVLPCLHYTHKTFNPDKAFHLACMNGLNFVAAEFGQHFDDYWLRMGHNVVPMLKATCAMFWDRWPKKMQASVTPFRMPQNYNQYIYSWWQILSGQYIDHRAPRTYLPVDANVNEIIQGIRTADGLLCINDNNEVDDITNLAATVRSEIEKRL